MRDREIRDALEGHWAESDAITDLVLSYDGVPLYTGNIMEFSGEKVARETQYFGDPFKPGPSRAHLVDPNH
jgi:hypothetical protein